MKTKWKTLSRVQDFRDGLSGSSLAERVDSSMTAEREQWTAARPGEPLLVTAGTVGTGGQEPRGGSAVGLA